MVKSKIRKIIDIFSKNETILRLFDEFNIDFNSVIKDLVENILLQNDELIQENTVLNLAENPNRKGKKTKVEIEITNTNVDGKFFWLFSPNNTYYVWYDKTSTTTDPNPQNPTNKNMYGLKVALNPFDDIAIIANKTKNAIDATGEFDAEVTTTYREIPEAPEITSITTSNDVANGNASYSGGYFFLYDKNNNKYSFWFDVDNSSIQPNPGGTLIKISITSSDDENLIAQKISQAVNTIPAFNSNYSNNNVIVTTTASGATIDASAGSLGDILEVTTVRQGNDRYIRVDSTLIVENKIEGKTLQPRNSFMSSPNFNFNLITLGEDDDISILNQKISELFGFYPEIIPEPHENNYRQFKSENNTLYVYFLKWIYFVYKYFNEDQFFFQNILKHYIPEYDSRVISSTNNLKIYFDGLGILLDTLDQKIDDLYTLGDIDEVDDRFLQHIAQLLGYQKEDFSIKNISFRELIKNLVEIYQRKGTVYSFELFFKLLGFKAELKEYYWDRDAKNPEGFASVTPTDYLYYLTTQDPRLRTKAQLEDMSFSYPIQPVRNEQFVKPKDLRLFKQLQSEYSLEEILGFKDSSLPPDDRFTYFKTNYINFQLFQFYTKQDLTAKDTETILKYVKFLTPIYISAFVEVVTKPWEDLFTMSNPQADKVNIDGNPGQPRWVDILLPFLYITLKEYIPINLDPAPESATIVLNYGSTDNDQDGLADDCTEIIFGKPAYGITIRGTVNLENAVLNLSKNKYINLKVDSGKGYKVTIRGNASQTYQQLLNRINDAFNNLSIPATATFYGVSPNIDIRITSNTTGTNSKILLAKSNFDDLFSALNITPKHPINGTRTTNGFQDFGLSISNINGNTGLDPTKNFIFYINVDDVDFTELDVSGINPSETTIDNIIDEINNNFNLKNNIELITSTNIEYLDVSKLANDKIVIAFREVNTNSGKLTITNFDGSPFRTGINFSRFDCRSVTVAPSTNPQNAKFFLSYYDLISNQLKWTVFNKDGDKELNDRVIEQPSVGVIEVKSLTLENGNIVLVYTTTTPAKTWARLYNIETLQEITTSPIEIYNGIISSLELSLNTNGFVVAGKVGVGIGLIIYLKNTCEFAINNNQNDSTKIISNTGQEISKVKIKRSKTNNLVILYSCNKSTPPVDEAVYLTIWSDGAIGTPTQVLPPTKVVNLPCDNIDLVITENNDCKILYTKSDNKYCYYKVFKNNGTQIKKETLLFNENEVKDFKAIIKEKILSLIITTTTKCNFLYLVNFGNIASKTQNGFLEFNSILAGATWDDTVENYAYTSDMGHKFFMDNSEYVYDNYSTYLQSIGVNLTRERNAFNTFYRYSPNDDLIPLIEDTINFLFTLLISSNEFPNDRVDKFGFYISRNGYISRNSSISVYGNSEKRYYTRHLDVSEVVRNSTDRVKLEIDWPQWKKDLYDKSNEITSVNFHDNTSLNNQNYSGQYFYIYNGITKFKIIYNLNNSSNIVLDNRAINIVVNITSADTPNNIAQKTSLAINSNSLNNFTVLNNFNPLIIKSNYLGESVNSSSSTQYISIETISEGFVGLSYNDWSSWTLAIDNFKVNLNLPSYTGGGKLTLKGTAYPAGPFKEFVYGVPMGVAAGAWLIEGDPTGKAIIEFKLLDPDPSVVWPIGAKISYIGDDGRWKTLDNTVRSIDGKTLTAEVDHFSVWGVVDKNTGQLISDDYLVEIEVYDAKIVRISRVEGEPSGLGAFGGSGYPYGRYEEFEYDVEVATITINIESEVLLVKHFLAPRPTGKITTYGVGEYKQLKLFIWIASGKFLLRRTTSISNIVDLYATAESSKIIILGNAIYFQSDYSYFPTGGVLLSGSSDIIYSKNYLSPTPYGWIQILGSSITSHQREFYYYPTDGKILFKDNVSSLVYIEYLYFIEAEKITISGSFDYGESKNYVYNPLVVKLQTNGESHFEIEIIFTFEIDYPLLLSYQYDSTLIIEIEPLIETEAIQINGESEKELELEYTLISGGLAISGSAEIYSKKDLDYVGGLLFDDASKDTTLYDNGLNNIDANILAADIIGDFVVVGGVSSRIASFDLQNKRWRKYDGSGNPNGPYSQNVLGGNDVLKIKYYYGVLLVAGSGGKIANYHPNLGWTYPDGSGAGVQPYDNGTLSNNNDIVDIAVIDDVAVFLTRDGRVFNYKYGHGWTTSIGGGLGLQPYNNRAHNGLRQSNVVYNYDNIMLIFAGDNYVSNFYVLENYWTYFNGNVWPTAGGSNNPYDDGTFIDFEVVSISSFYDENNNLTLTFSGKNGEVANFKFDFESEESWTKKDGTGLGSQPYGTLSFKIKNSISTKKDVVIFGENGNVVNFNTLYYTWNYGNIENSGDVSGNLDLNVGVNLDEENFILAGNSGRIAQYQYKQLRNWLKWNHLRGTISNIYGTSDFTIEVFYEAIKTTILIKHDIDITPYLELNFDFSGSINISGSYSNLVVDVTPVVGGLSVISSSANFEIELIPETQAEKILVKRDIDVEFELVLETPIDVYPISISGNIENNILDIYITPDTLSIQISGIAYRHIEYNVIIETVEITINGEAEVDHEIYFTATGGFNFSTITETDVNINMIFSFTGFISTSGEANYLLDLTPDTTLWGEANWGEFTWG